MVIYSADNYILELVIGYESWFFRRQNLIIFKSDMNKSAQDNHNLIAVRELSIFNIVAPGKID